MLAGQDLGLRITLGVHALQNATALQEATVVSKIQEAGLIVLGKANLAVGSLLAIHTIC